MTDSAAPASPRGLAAVLALSVALAGAATSLTLFELPAWAPALGPEDHLAASLAAGLCLALLLPVMQDPSRIGDWLGAGLLCAAVLGPVLLVGVRLAFEPAALLLRCALWLVACWAFGSGLYSLLSRLTTRPAGHYLALLLALCLLPPMLDFTMLELMHGQRMFAYWSPLERLVAPPADQALWAPLALIAAGLTLVWRCR